jgi:hypothetical protein
VDFGIPQTEIALFAASHRPDIFPCKLDGCKISIKITTNCG